MRTHALYHSTGLENIRLQGGGLTAQLARYITDASLQASTSEVSELQITFVDSLDSRVLRTGVLREGALLSAVGWSFQVNGWSMGAGDGGPTVTVNAPSRYVERLRKQTGAKSWGTQDISAWVAARAKEVGMVPVVQRNLGRQLFIRDKPEGDQKPSTWDLMVEGAAVGGAWLFEHGNRLVLARPSYLATAMWGGRRWSFAWNGWTSISGGLQEMPRYETQSGEETLELRVISVDRYAMRPGDRLVLSGYAVRKATAGTWLVESVDVPMFYDAPAVVRCVRPIDPDKADPRTPEQNTSATTAGRGGAGGSSSVRTGGSVSVNSTAAARVMSWAKRVNGGSYDYDGGYGAQCVDLPKKYNAEVIRGAAFRGNGKDVARNAVRAGSYVWVPASSRARIGDIVSWNGSWGGGYGHTGIVLEDRGSSLYCVHQNYGRTKISAVSKSGLLGYARPRRIP